MRPRLSNRSHGSGKRRTPTTCGGGCTMRAADERCVCPPRFSAMPDLSIIIPVFNCLELTRACLASLEETIGQRQDFEVILVDDGSTDGTRAWLSTLPAPRYRVLINETNRGYA